ncbi:MAG: hypothetical protein JOY75_06950 [Hyphomicrobiales bacterium]|nr:hypothetical protein [Hyphomicrobiales bacterium]
MQDSSFSAGAAAAHVATTAALPRKRPTADEIEIAVDAAAINPIEPQARAHIFPFLIRAIN